jgi:hypothetical protein
LLPDRDEMRKLYRGPSIDASYQVSVHLVQLIQRSRLKYEKNESKLGRKHHWKVLYKDCSFSSDLLTKMVATGHSYFWLADF